MNNFFLFLYFGIALLNLFLAALAFIKNPRGKTNQFFLFLVLSIIGWIITLYFFYNLYNEDYVLFLGRSNFCFAILIAYFSFMFSIFFPRRIFNLPKIVSIFLAIETIFLTSITLFTNLVDSNEIISKSERITEYGSLYFLFVIHFILYALFAAIILIYKYRKVSKYLKIQIFYFFWGFILSIFFGSITNIFIPLFFKYYTIQNIGPVATLFFCIFTFYAIVKYRLMDIKFIISRSVIFFIFTLSITATFVLVSSLSALFFADSLGTNPYLVWMITSVFIVLIINPLKNFLAKITDKIFFKGAIDYNKILQQLSNTLSEELSVKIIVAHTEESLVKNLKLKKSLLVLSEGEGLFFHVDEDKISLIKKNKFKQQQGIYIPNLVNYLEKKKEIIVYDELERLMYEYVNEKEINKIEKILGDIKKFNAALVVPIIRANQITALLFLGQKSSGDVYNDNDIRMLEMLAPQLSSALFKASLYQEAQLFNIKLQKEIEKATAELKVVNHQLEHANEHLQNLDKAKSEFMSITSHQLRTPLTGIMGYLSMIIEGDYGKMKSSQAQILKEVFEASQRLIRMVNLFLNVTRIEAGTFNFFWQETDMYELIKDQVHELMPNAKKKGLALELLPAPKDFKLAIVDRDKVKDVILNLIDNATKYTEKGSIKVSLAKKDTNNFEIIIKDTGIGIDPQEAEKLFEKFTRGDGMAKINPNGAGLGLFIAKKMVEGHHGKVWVESEGVGKGSEFHVVLPINQDKTENK